MAKVLSGILTAGDGTALANQSIKIVAISSTPPGVIKGAESVFTTDGLGAYSVTMENGSYRVTAESASGGDIALGNILVQGLDPSDLPTLLALNEEPGRPVDDALQALADAAATSAQEAADSADLVNPANFIAVTEKGAANGVAELGADGKVPDSQLPSSDVRASKLDNPLTHLFKKNKLVDTLSGALTWTRATTATYVDRYGVVQSAAIDEAREESEGWLIEGASTNLLTYSEDFSNAAWNKVACTIAANNTTSPDGAVTADKIVEDSSNTAHNVRSPLVSFVSGTQYTFSVYLKEGENQFVALQARDSVFGTARSVSFDLAAKTYNITTGTLDDVQIRELSDGWCLCSITATAEITAANTSPFWIGLAQDDTTTNPSYQGDGVSGIYAWGAQIEELPFASSYIPTTTAAVTRAADVVEFSFDNNINGYDEAKSVSVKTDFFGFRSSNMALFDTDGSVDLRYQATVGGGAAFKHGGNSAIPSVNPNQKYDFAGTYDGTTELNNYIDGVSAGINSSGTALGSGVGTSVRVGNTTAGSAATAYFGHLQDFRIYDFALNADEIAWLAGE